jgi:RNA polymerase sigma factor (sigma-70 family)
MFGFKKYSDEALLADLKSGGVKEGKAISQLLKVNKEKIKALVLRSNGSAADAEDILLEGITALILSVRKGNFRGESSIHTYLYAICKGAWFKRFKKYAKEQDYKRNLAIVEEDAHTPEISLMQQEQKQMLLKLFDVLKEKCKEVLYLWASAYSMNEIAEQLSYNNSQVAMNKKNRCLKQLHEMIRNDKKVQSLLKEL